LGTEGRSWRYAEKLGIYTTPNPKERQVVILVKNVKSKAIPVTGREGPWGFEMSRLSHSIDCQLTDGGKVVRLRRRPPIILPEVDSRAIRRLEESGQLRKYTSSRFEPATVRLVA
jgi:hypothetical protein